VVEVVEVEGDLEDRVAAHGELEWAEAYDELAVSYEVGTLLVKTVA